MEITEIFEKLNVDNSKVYTRDCGCPYRFQPTFNKCKKPDRCQGGNRKQPLLITTHNNQSQKLSYSRTKQRKMTQDAINFNNECSNVSQPKYLGPKRYESTCYFKPLAVPIWYTTSISIKIGSTKRNYREAVNYQTKLIAYRYVETMRTDTEKEPSSVKFVSEVHINNNIPPEEHYISLEPQQSAFEIPFESNCNMYVEN